MPNRYQFFLEHSAADVFVPNRKVAYNDFTNLHPSEELFGGGEGWVPTLPGDQKMEGRCVMEAVAVNRTAILRT